MKVYKKILGIFVLVAVCASLIQIQRLGYLKTDVQKYYHDSSEVIMSQTTVNKISESNIVNDDKTLIIYDQSDRVLTNYAEVIAQDLKYLKINTTTIQARKAASTNYDEYNNIVILVSRIEQKLDQQLYKLMKYVEQGGRLYFANALDGYDEDYAQIYNKIGISELKGYEQINGIKFITDVIPGAGGREFIDAESFGDSPLTVTLDSEAKVHIESAGSNPGIPILWEKKLGKGKVVVYNGTALGAEFYGGVFAGGYSILQDDFMYPIINAKVIYIDDFPAPQYNTEFPTITEVYNKNIKDYFRDVWWPDMQKVAKKYNYKYTGLFISTYNQEVNPDNFKMEDFEYFQYYGNSLIKNGYEVGLHGYNHQSLGLEGFVPDYIGYKGWASQEDMEAGIKLLSEYVDDLFPGVTFGSYVPPSNFLSPEGRKALVNAVPTLKIISGLSFDDSKEQKAYVQKFEIAEDGIAEFPRITSGMWKDDDIQFMYLNGLGLNGVFSHFIHPDDILDDQRGRGKLWDDMINEFSWLLKDVNDNYPSIRSLKSVDAADALKVYDELKVALDYKDDRIEGACDNFYGQAFFYLRTEKTPKTKDNSVKIEAMGKGNYYLVTVNEPTFTIKLEDKQ